MTIGWVTVRARARAALASAEADYARARADQRDRAGIGDGGATDENGGHTCGCHLFLWRNVFAAAHADGRDEGVLDDIRDLRRYLLLVDSEVTRV